MNLVKAKYFRLLNKEEINKLSPNIYKNIEQYKNKNINVL